MSSFSSALAGAAPDSTPSPADQTAQSSQPVAARPAAPAAPDVSALPPNGPRLTSALARIVGMPTATPPPAQPAWKKALGTGLGVISSALAGIPDKGRPSFITGLGEGARGNVATTAAQQEIKFRDFDSQVKAAELHNQDLHQQNATQEASDAHEDHLMKVRADEANNDWGLDGDTIANHGPAAITHAQNQTAANGAVTVSPMARISDDNVSLPYDTPSNNNKILDQMRSRGGLFGITVPDGATKVPANQAKAFNNMLQGYKADGSQYNHDELPGQIASEKAKIAQLQQIGTSADNMTLMNSILKYHQTLLSDLDTHASQVAGQKKGAETQAVADVANNPTNQAAAAKGAGMKAGAIANAELPAKQALQDNAAGNKPGKVDTAFYVGTDAAGNQIAGTSDQLKAANANGVTKLDADTAKKVTQAREMISPDGLFSAVAKDVQDLQAKGKLGVAASRWNAFMGGTVGTDPDFAPLRTDMGLLATKLMQVHVGARGSAEMLHHFANLADYKISDAPTLTAALKAEYRYIHGAAMLPKTQTPSGGQ